MDDEINAWYNTLEFVVLKYFCISSAYFLFKSPQLHSFIVSDPSW
jgi:hypothetical protein